MKIQTFHPFQISVSKGIWESGSTEILVNGGIVYNFYNPGNFRKVRFDASGDELPKLPLSPTINEESKRINPKNISLRLGSGIERVTIYLVASFLPPLKWVPSSYYIPKIDRAWLLFRVYEQKDEQGSFTLYGTTKNLSSDNIKYETFDVNSFEFPEHVDETSFYEPEPVWMGNVFNLGIVGTIEKDNDGNWNITQCIKDNFPITFFLNIQSYQVCNTERFSNNISEILEGEEYDLKRQEIEGKNSLVFMPISVHNYRGNIQNSAVTLPSTRTNQLKFPLIYSSFKEGVLPAYVV